MNHLESKCETVRMFQGINFGKLAYIKMNNKLIFNSLSTFEEFPKNT